MALNINFKNTNSLLRMMLPYLMQYKMGEASNQRIMDRQMQSYSEQDRLMRERSAAEDVLARRTHEYKSKINIKEALEKAFIDVAKTDVGYNNSVKMAQLAERQGDMASAQKYRDDAFNKATPTIQAVMDATKGKVSNEGFMAAMNGLGDDAIKLLMDRATKESELEIDRSKLGLEEKKHGLERQKFGLDVQKFGAEQAGLGPFKTTDYYRVMHTKIEGVKKYLTSMKEFIESGGDISTIAIDWKKLISGPATPKLLGQTLTMLSKYDTEAMEGKLAPSKVRYIDNAYDIASLQEGAIPGVSAEDTMKLEEETNRALETETPKVPVTSAITARPSIHPVGEKKTITINGVRATYIWDGEKWLLSNSQ